MVDFLLLDDTDFLLLDDSTNKLILELDTVNYSLLGTLEGVSEEELLIQSSSKQLYALEGPSEQEYLLITNNG